MTDRDAYASDAAYVEALENRAKAEAEERGRKLAEEHAAEELPTAKERQSREELHWYGRRPKRTECGLYAEPYSWVQTPGMPHGWLTPVLLARVAWHGSRVAGYCALHVWCPYCGREHAHGGSRRPLQDAGFRTPHCPSVPWLLDNRASYIVAVRDEATGAIVTIGSPMHMQFTLFDEDRSAPEPRPMSWTRHPEDDDTP